MKLEVEVKREEEEEERGSGTACVPHPGWLDAVQAVLRSSRELIGNKGRGLGAKIHESG